MQQVSREILYLLTYLLTYLLNEHIQVIIELLCYQLHLVNP